MRPFDRRWTAVARGRRRSGALALALATTVVAALTAPAAFAKVPAHLVYHHRVARPGRYRVAIEVTTASPTRNVVSIAIGPLRRHATTTGNRRRTRVVVTLSVRNTLTIAAVAGQRPSMSVSLRRVPPAFAAWVMYRHVRTRGLYAISVGITAHSRRRNRIELQVGPLRRRTATFAGHLRVRLLLRLRISRPQLIVRAVGRRGLPTVTVRLRRLGALRAAVPTPKTAAPPGPPAPAVVTPPPSAPAAPSAVPSAASPGAPVGIPGAWRLMLDDEFSGGDLSGTSFRPGWLPSSAITPDVGGASSHDCLVPTHAVVAGGELDLVLTAAPSWCGGITQPYSAGLVSTTGQYAYTYGAAEARIWLPAASDGTIANWPSFWATGTPWPQAGEDDILEGLAGLACYHFHWGSSSSAAQSAGDCAPGTWTGGWHTFASDWEPGSITYYYDGIRVGQLVNGITSAPEALVLGMSVGGTFGGQIVTPATERVDYVRVWQH